jgi:hypothetical protein
MPKFIYILIINYFKQAEERKLLEKISLVSCRTQEDWGIPPEFVSPHEVLII